MVRSVTRLFVCLSMMLMPVAAYSQVAGAQPSAVGASPESEDIEPRIVGHKGTTQIGFAGFFDRVYSSEKLMPLNYTVQFDAGRFITKRFVANSAWWAAAAGAARARRTLPAAPARRRSRPPAA
jgi:hypothetical protein